MLSIRGRCPVLNDLPFLTHDASTIAWRASRFTGGPTASAGTRYSSRRGMHGFSSTTGNPFHTASGSSPAGSAPATHERGSRITSSSACSRSSRGSIPSRCLNQDENGRAGGLAKNTFSNRGEITPISKNAPGTILEKCPEWAVLG